MRLSTIAASVALGALSATLPSPAAADENTAVAGSLANVRATENDGFGELKWGADLKAVYGRYPELKKLYPQAKVAGLLKAGQTVVVETKLTFKGVAYPGKLALDSGGLVRVTIEVKGEDDPSVTMDKLLDPILGDLSAPDEETPDTRLWKGSATVISVTKTREVGRFRLDVSFFAKGKYRPESAGGSLGIE